MEQERGHQEKLSLANKWMLVTLTLGVWAQEPDYKALRNEVLKAEDGDLNIWGNVRK